MDSELIDKLTEIKERQSISIANIIGIFGVFNFLLLQYLGFGNFSVIACLLIGPLFQYFARGVGSRFRLLAIFYTFLCFLSLIFISSYVVLGFARSL